MGKCSLLFLKAFLFSLSAFLFIAQSAHSNSGCVRSQLQQELAKIDSLDKAQAQRLKSLLEARDEITVDDLVAVVRLYGKSDFDQMNVIRKYVSKVKDLDGRKLVSIVNSMSVHLVHSEDPKVGALRAGLDAIRNLKAGDLDVVMQALHGTRRDFVGGSPLVSNSMFRAGTNEFFSPAQRSLISAYLPKVSDLDMSKLESIANTLEYRSDKSLALKEGKNLLASVEEDRRPAAPTNAANGSKSPSAKSQSAPPREE